MAEDDQKPEASRVAVVTESWVDLKLRAFRAEVRLLVALSLVANQVFAHVNVPSELTAGAFLAIGAKLVLAMR